MWGGCGRGSRYLGKTNEFSFSHLKISSPAFHTFFDVAEYHRRPATDISVQAFARMKTTDDIERDAASRRIQGLIRQRTQHRFSSSYKKMRSNWDTKLFDALPIFAQQRASAVELAAARSGKLVRDDGAQVGLTHWTKLHNVISATTRFRSGKGYHQAMNRPGARMHVDLASHKCVHAHAPLSHPHFFPPHLRQATRRRTSARPFGC